MKYLLIWPIANLRRHALVTATVVGTVALVVFTVVSLLGFISGYERAAARDVDRLGFDVLVTARGCPYEAATLMLKGGSGLRYIPSGFAEKITRDPRVGSAHPMLVHPLRDHNSESGMLLVKGVEPAFAETQKLEILQGSWFDGTEGVVLGFEAAELTQRHAGDTMLLAGTTEPVKIIGVLERTGSQLDGTALMELGQLQRRYGLEGRLTGLGVQLKPARRDELPSMLEAWNSEPELQAIALDRVTAALRTAMEDLRSLVALLSATLGILGCAVLSSTAMLKTLAERRRHASLQLLGVPHWFIVSAVAVESSLMAGFGAAVGLVMTVTLGAQLGVLLAGFLPYTPSGELVLVSSGLAARAFAATIGVAVVATLPGVLRILYGNLNAALQVDR